VNHAVLGASAPLLLAAVYYLARGRRASLRLLVLAPALAAASALWAVAPDLPRLWGDLPRYVAWHHASWCDLAWGHCWIDAGEVDRPWFALAFAAVGGLLLWVAWRELRRAEASEADR
jgi:hypothetical protein